MKQLIEEQKKLPKLICDLVWSVTDGGTKIKESQLLSYQDEPVREYEDILNWHKQSLKQFIDGLITWQEEEVRHPLETIARLKELKEELINGMTKNNSKEPTWQDIEKTFRQSEAARNLYADEFYEILQFFKPYFQELEEKAWMYDNLSK